MTDFEPRIIDKVGYCQWTCPQFLVGAACTYCKLDDEEVKPGHDICPEYVRQLVDALEDVADRYLQLDDPNRTEEKLFEGVRFLIGA